MEATLTRVLADVERAIVVSLHDTKRVIFANPAMQRWLPGVHPDMAMDDFSQHVSYVYEQRRPTGVSVVHALSAPGDTAARFTKMLGGIWVLASHLPYVEAYPPSALVTFHRGNDSQESKAWRVHRPIAYITCLALEIDEAKRELEIGSQMVVQAHARISKMADGLVEYQTATSREMIDGGIELDGHRGVGG